jgi:hypothetical protein
VTAAEPAPLVERPEPVDVRPLDENLAMLEDLALFQVGDVVLDLPAEASHCYGICEQWQAEADAQRAEQNVRLSALVDIAVEVRALPYVDTEASASDSLSLLEGLQLIEVGELVVDQPANNPDCYNLPCESDVRAAEQSNARRAAELAAIAERARDL